MTKAEAFRYQQERSGPKKRPQLKRRGGTDYPGTVGASEVNINDLRRRKGRTASRNWGVRAGKKAPYALEDSPNGKPSRRSTRKSSNGQKPSHPWRSSKVNAILAERPKAAPRRSMSPPNA